MPFHRESQRGHGTLNMVRDSMDTGAFPRGETAWTQDPLHGERQRGHGSLSTGRVCVDTGAFPRGESV